MITGSLLIFFLLVILCLSPIAKYLLQKYDLQIIGREITVESAYVNPFTGYLCFNGIKIFESHSDSVFISAKSLSGNFALLKLPFNTYEIDHLHLTDPKVYVIQNQEQINFQDIIDFYTPKQPHKKKENPTRINLLDLQIRQGEFFYFEKSIPVSYSVKKLDASSPGLKWGVDTMNIRFDFFSGEEPGEMKGDMVVELNNGNYRMNANMKKYNLHVLEQYLKDLSNFGKFRANVDADFKASGNFKKAQEINTKGLFVINDLHVGKTSKDDYAALEKFTLKIEQLNPQGNKYLFDSLSLLKPYCKFELYDSLNNIEMMFGKAGESAVNHSRFNIIVAIGKYIEQLAKNFFKSDYKLNRLAIYNGNFKYNDFTLNEKFSVSANPVYFMADSIKRSDKPVDFVFKAGLKPYGDASVFISINPKDSSDFDFRYSFDQIPITLFNPYLIRYTSFPLDRGTLELNGSWHVRNSIISSSNHLVIIDPRVYRRLKNKANHHLPMHLITYMVRERGNVIDYEIPITGNLKNPKFHFKDVIRDVAGNIFLKPFHAPYIIKVRSVEKKMETMRVLRWEMRQSSLSRDQEEFMEMLSHFLLEHPHTVLSIDQSVYVEKEKEYIALFEAKKQYYLHRSGRSNPYLTAAEERAIEEMSIKDSLFIRFLNARVHQPLLFTVQEKCYALIGGKNVEAQFRQLLKDRERSFLNYFGSKELAARIKIKPMEDKIPYNGFSSYRIDYHGALPGELQQAMEKMDELNNEKPRAKFKKDREKRRSLIRSSNRKTRKN